MSNSTYEHKTRASFLMCTYNASQTLELSIGAILNQSCPYFDLIVIDNGSTDDTRRILINYSHRDSRVKLAFLDEPCLTKALVYGLSLITTEFILRIDSDDICSPYRLEKSLEFMKDNPNVDIAFSRYYISSIDNKIIDQKGTPHVLCHSLRTFDLLIRNPIAHSSLCFRTNIFRDHELSYCGTKEPYHYSHSQDLLLLSQAIFLKNLHIAQIPEYLVTIVKTLSSISFSHSLEQSRIATRIFLLNTLISLRRNPLCIFKATVASALVINLLRLFKYEAKPHRLLGFISKNFIFMAPDYDLYNLILSR